MSSVPRTKSGIDSPMSDTTRVPMSAREFRRRAATTPAGMPKTSDISVARTVNSMVMPDRRTISVETGVRMRNDWPRSPRSALPSHRPYCTMSGWSRPYRFSMAATTSGCWTAFGPSSAWTNPPGTRRIATKTIVATPRAVINAVTIRVATYRGISGLEPRPAPATQSLLAERHLLESVPERKTKSLSLSESHVADEVFAIGNEVVARDQSLEAGNRSNRVFQLAQHLEAVLRLDGSG